MTEPRLLLDHDAGDAAEERIESAREHLRLCGRFGRRSTLPSRRGTIERSEGSRASAPSVRRPREVSCSTRGWLLNRKRASGRGIISADPAAGNRIRAKKLRPARFELWGGQRREPSH